MADREAKILVVDDFGPNRTAYVGWLGQIAGAEVVLANGGQEALDLARRHDFALFILDINMPDMDGFELASLLRQEPRSGGTPIIFVTSEAVGRTYMLRGYRMGAVDVMMSGPVQGEILVQKARVLIQLYAKRLELQGMLERVGRQNQELHAKLEEFIRQQETLREAATHDPLTKLPNRTLFHDRLDAAIHRSQRGKQRFALAYVDLDGFKDINDTYGHATGDSLIITAAQRLRSTVRATDTVARLGGDEFALLFEGLDSAAGATYIAEKLHQLLTQPVTLAVDGREPAVIRTGASIGLALYPDHSREKSDLMALADMTMYAVKREGGGARLYGGHGNSKAAEHLHLVRPG